MWLKNEASAMSSGASRPYICVPRAGIGRVIAANGGILDSHGILQIDRGRANLNRIGFEHPPLSSTRNPYCSRLPGSYPHPVPCPADIEWPAGADFVYEIEPGIVTSIVVPEPSSHYNSHF
jgi:hypothetical protein